MTNVITSKLRVAPLFLLLLLLPFSKLHADEYDDFWMWLNHVKDELNDTPSWHENEFRANGYMNAVDSHLQKLNTNITGYVEVSEDQSYTLNLFSDGSDFNNSVLDAFPIINEISKRAEKHKDWSVTTIIDPGGYREFEIKLYSPDNGKYRSQDIRLLIDESKVKKGITVFLPNLENIIDQNNRKNYLYRFRSHLVRHIGEHLFVTKIGEISYKPLSEAQGDLIGLNQLLENIN